MGLSEAFLRQQINSLPSRFASTSSALEDLAKGQIDTWAGFRIGLWNLV